MEIKNIKIALIDNMNNNMFALARYFRAQSIEADLFVIHKSGVAHFSPRDDTWEDMSEADWIKEFPVNYQWWNYFRPIGILRKTLAGYDKVIACGRSVGLLNRAGITIDLFIPYGSDLINAPFFSISRLPGPFYKFPFQLLLSFRRARLQREGIKSAKKIACNTNWGIANMALSALACTALNIPRVMVYKENLPATACRRFEFFKEYDFVLFSPTRHLWKTNSEPVPDFLKYGGAKRNDKLIRAFARAVNKNLFARPIMVFCDYGSDVTHSKRLIKELKIERFVAWLPIMPRKELVAGLRAATVVADQFREGMSATSSGITNEAIAYGTPVITNTDGAIYDEADPYFGCPILQAVTEEEIYRHISFFSGRSQKENDDFSVYLIQWFEANLGCGLAKRYIELVDSSDQYLVKY